MQNTSLEALFLDAVSSAIQGKRVHWETLSPELWQGLFRLAEQQKLLPLLTDAVCECPSFDADAGCDHGICVMYPDFEEHWAAAHSGRLMARLTVDRSSATVDEPITWTASAVGGTGTVRYCFDVVWEDYEAHQGDFVYEGSWTTTPTLTFTPTVPGEYTAWLSVKDAAGKEVSRIGDSVPELEVLSVTPEKTSAEAGEFVAWTVTMVGETPARRIQYDLYRDGVLVQPGYYTATPTFGYVLDEPGVYTVR